MSQSSLRVPELVLILYSPVIDRQCHSANWYWLAMLQMLFAITRGFSVNKRIVFSVVLTLLFNEIVVLQKHL